MNPYFEENLAKNFTDDAVLVYSKVQIAELTHKATGRRMTVKEAKDRFGPNVVREIAENGSAIIFGHPRHPDYD